jgi:putative FmdB family regulatory protein
MPLYEYHCPAYGLEFEALVPYAQADKQKCETCGKPAQPVASCCFGSTSDNSATSAEPCLSGG